MMRRLSVVGIGIELAVALPVSGFGYFLGRSAIYNGDSDWAVGFFLAGLAWPVYFIVWLFCYGAAAAIFLCGLFTGRIGLMVGPALFGLALILLTSFQTTANKDIQADEAARAKQLDQREFLSLHGQHQVIAVEGEEEGNCREFCQRLLATTDYFFAARRMSHEDWMLYRRIEGDACHSADTQGSALDFIRAGYVGICATRERWVPGDGIFVIADRSYKGGPEKLVGPNFRGEVFEAYERIAGKDRLLARWLHGHVSAQPDQYSALSAERSAEVGTFFGDQDFYAALLGVVPAGKTTEKTTGPASADAQFAALLELADHADSDEAVLAAADQLAQSLRDATVLNWVDQSLSSSDRRRKLMGFRMLSVFNKTYDLDKFKAPLTAALTSGDPVLTNAALKPIYVFRDPLFAMPAIEQLVFGPLLRTDRNLGAQLFSSLKALPAPFTKEMRDRAETGLRSGERTSGAEVSVLLLVIGRKHAGSHAQFFDFVQSLQGETFEMAVRVICGSGWGDIEGSDVNKPSAQEIAVFAERVGAVPDDRFEAYINAFRFIAGVEPFEDDLLQEVERRLALLQQHPAGNDDLIRVFERLKQEMSFGHL